LRRAGHTRLGRIVPIVADIVFRRCDPLVVRGDDSRAENRAHPGCDHDLCHRVGLIKILVRVAIGLHDAEVRLQNGALILVMGRELELIDDRIVSDGEIGPLRDDDLVEHIVVEIVLVGTDTRFFERVNGEGDLKNLGAGRLGYECVDVGLVGGWIEGDSGASI